MKAGRKTKAETQTRDQQPVWGIKVYPELDVIDLKKHTKADMEVLGLYYATTDIYIKLPWNNDLWPLTDFEPIQFEAEGIQWTHVRIEPILRGSGTLLAIKGDKYIPAKYLGNLAERM